MTLWVVRALTRDRAQQRIRFDARAVVSQFIANKIDFQGRELRSAYAAEVVNSIGSTIEGSSFSGLRLYEDTFKQRLRHMICAECGAQRRRAFDTGYFHDRLRHSDRRRGVAIKNHLT